MLNRIVDKLKRIAAPPEKAAKYLELLQAFRSVAHHYSEAAELFRDGKASVAKKETRRGVMDSARGVTLAEDLNLPACGAG